MSIGDRKPLIGLSVGFHDFGDYQGVGFQRPIGLAGGVPMMLSRVEEILDESLDVCDGIALGGGRDIDPSFYGQEPSERLAATEPLRDAFELELVKRALDRGLPILGMCRGVQIVNVALGGTLVQDVSLVEDWADHPSDRGWQRWKEVERASLRNEPEIPEHPRHPMTIVPGSLLHEALGVEEAEVNSFHHQAIDRLAPGLRSTGQAPDGVIEVIELEDGPYLLAAQFELHEEWRVDRRFLALFEQFVAAAGRKRPA